MKKPDIYNASHPSRQLAIHILESIAVHIKQEDIFDCKNGEPTWYDLEDMVTNLIEENRK